MRPAASTLLRLGLLFGLAGLAAPAFAGEQQVGSHAWLRFQRCEGRCTTLPQRAFALAPGRREALEAAGFGHVELFQRSHIRLRRDGVVEEHSQRVRRYLGDAGIGAHGNLGFPVQASHQDALIEDAYVRLPDGRHVAVAPATVQVQTDSRTDIFSDRYEVVLPMAGLVPGADAVLSSRTRFRSGDWPLPWSRIEYLRRLVPLEYAEVMVEWEEGVAEPAWASDEPALRCERPAPRRLLCVAEQLPAFALDPDVASYGDRVSHLVVAEPRSWKQLAGAVASLVAQGRVPTPALEALATRLAAGNTTPHQRFAAAQHFVSDEVRYVALEHGTSAVVPHPAGVTLERRYGDCKDKVTLFLTLLDRAGVKAWPVLAASAYTRPEKLLLPAAGYFDHMVACSAASGDGDFCADLTAAGLPAGVLPLGLQGAVGLGLHADDPTPMQLPQSEYAWTVKVNANVEVRCDGSVHETLTRSFFDAGGASVRAGLRGLRDDERTRWAEQETRGLLGKQIRPQFGFEGLDDADAPLVIVMDAKYPSRGEIEQMRHIQEADVWLIYYAKDFMSENRHHPFRSAGLQLESRVRYKLCPKLRPGFLGARLSFESEFGSLTRHWSRDGEAVDVRTQLALRRGELEPAELERRNRFLTRALENTNIWFGLEPVEP